MNINRINNVNFTSRMIVRATPKEIEELENALHQDAIELSEKDKIVAVNVQSNQHGRYNYSTQYVTDEKVKEELFDDFKNGSRLKNGKYLTPDYSSVYPFENFSVSIVPVKQNLESGDALYLVATHKDADKIEDLRTIFIQSKSGITIYRQNALHEKKRSLQNEFIDAAEDCREYCRQLLRDYKKILSRFKSSIPDVMNAGEVLAEMKKGGFNAQSLCFIQKSHI